MSEGFKTPFDQISLNTVISQNNITVNELDGKWNCQISFNGLRYLNEAKIMHIFNSVRGKHPCLLGRQETFDLIRKQERLPDEVVEMILRPKSSFDEMVSLLNKEDYLMRFSKPVQRTFALYNEAPGCYKVLSCLTKVLMGVHILTQKSKSVF